MTIFLSPPSSQITFFVPHDSPFNSEIVLAHPHFFLLALICSPTFVLYLADAKKSQYFHQMSAYFTLLSGISAHGGSSDVKDLNNQIQSLLRQRDYSGSIFGSQEIFGVRKGFMEVWRRAVNMFGLGWASRTQKIQEQEQKIQVFFSGSAVWVM